ncbi:MAG: dipeptidyl peptidase 3 [Culturomica sp.]|jgi:dipeptidyl-peptidase-3|nr:dipeptidyl peptidase 3 [Culturomica sp.]
MEYTVEQFDDIKILRYEVPAFTQLDLQQKLFVYYLSCAALAGRDILWDQNNRYNLRIRKLLEKIIKSYKGDITSTDFEAFLLYAKKVFFANGIHHHYSMDKFVPHFSKDYFISIANSVGITPEEDLLKVIFDTNYMSKRVVLDAGVDLIESSANNYYFGVTQKEVEDFYSDKTKGVVHPEMWGLNSTLIKRNGAIAEDVWKVDGKYGAAIKEIIDYLEKAKEYACNETQKTVIELLIKFYVTGDLKTFDEYSIKWVGETEAQIDFINGFIEVYGDPLAYKGSWESVVQIVDKEAGKRTSIFADNALWFERNAPIDDRFKKDEISGIVARVMQVAMLGGDCYPATPIGINLPNSEWIREEYGSKSVTLDNITYSYEQASQNSGVLDEFAYTEEEKTLARRYGYTSGNVHTDLHECLGHGSGKMLAGVTTESLKSYYSTIEEARADLFALYYIMDKKLQELGIVENDDVAKCEYNSYIRGGLLTQLTRIKLGCNVEESHMRNRQMIASWVYEKGRAENVIEKIFENGKTYFVVRDYQRLRELFGNLLSEVQRIKSEGDYQAAKDLIENYGVKVDYSLHQEVLQRYDKLNVAPYSGFLNPNYELIMKDDKIEDVKISYPSSFLEQMLAYGDNYGLL